MPNHFLISFASFLDDRWPSCVSPGMAIGFVDYITGYEMAFPSFTLPQYRSLSWFLGLTRGQMMATLSALTWVAVDYASGNLYSHPFIAFWNGFVRLGFFSIISIFWQASTGAATGGSTCKDRPLTGIMNARAFKEHAERFLALAARHGRPTVVGYIDLDNFKQ